MVSYTISAELVQKILDILGSLPFNKVAPVALELGKTIKEQNQIIESSTKDKDKKD